MSKERMNSGFGTALWNFFASIKLTVVVLILLAAFSIIGTLIPQNAAPSVYLNAYGEFVYRLLYVFDLFNMYYSWWFKTLIALLTANIIVCTLNRWPGIWKTISLQNLKFTFTGKKQMLSEFSDHREPVELDLKYRAYVKKKFKKISVETHEKGFKIIAEKGRWTRLGVPIVHLSIVFVLSGALVGSFFGFDGFVNIPEGGSADRIQLRNSKSVIELGFEVRCDDFDVSYYKTGAPKEYRSKLVVLEESRKILEKDIIVNDPLRYRGINFFQSSYGSMPPKNIKLSFTSKDTGTSVSHDLSIGQSVELPDEGGKFTLRRYNQDYHFRDSELGEAVIGFLEKPGHSPAEIALPLRFPSFDKMRKGEWVISVEELEKEFYTGLQVTSDPGVPLVYAGFILLIAGCWVTFLMSHRKIMIDVQVASNSSLIQIYGSTNRNHIGFEIMARKMGTQLQQLGK